MFVLVNVLEAGLVHVRVGVGLAVVVVRVFVLDVIVVVRGVGVGMRLAVVLVLVGVRLVVRVIADSSLMLLPVWSTSGADLSLSGGKRVRAWRTSSPVCG